MLYTQFLTSQTKCVVLQAKDVLGLLMRVAIVSHLRETFGNKRTPGTRRVEIQWIGLTRFVIRRRAECNVNPGFIPARWSWRGE